MFLLIAMLISPSFAQDLTQDPRYYQTVAVKHKVLKSQNTLSLGGGDQLEKVHQFYLNGGGPPITGNGVPPPIIQNDGGFTDPSDNPSNPNTPNTPTNPNSPYSGYGNDVYGGYDSYGGYSSYGGLSVMDTAMRIWDIVQKNRPVVTIDSAKFATALPKAVQNDWAGIGGFQPESNITYRTSYINGFGMETVRFEYQVKVVYGGNYKGRGLYIASARIIPIKLNAMWAYNVNVQVSVQSVFNIRTPENPLAAIQMSVLYTISTVLSSDMTTDTFEVRGNGAIIDTKNSSTLKPPLLKLRLQ